MRIMFTVFDAMHERERQKDGGAEARTVHHGIGRDVMRQKPFEKSVS